MASPLLRLHGNCVAREGAGVLILGPPGSGKSDLTLRLLRRGWDLIADDRVEIDGLTARAPAALSGLLEVRGFGIVRCQSIPETDLKLVIALTDDVPRLPQPDRHLGLDLPLVRLNAAHASAPERVALALDCALGRVAQVAGAFAP